MKKSPHIIRNFSGAYLTAFAFGLFAPYLVVASEHGEKNIKANATTVGSEHAPDSMEGQNSIAEGGNSQHTRTAADEKTCAFLEKFSGDVRLLNASREYSLEVKRNAPIPCEGWVSVMTGYAEIRHLDGYELRLGERTFTEFFESTPSHPDGVVIFRGLVMVEAGDRVVQIQTPNARARVQSARALVSFDPTGELTQAMAFGGNVILENRFETSRNITLRPGEVSELAYGADRVIPSLPQASQASSVAKALADLGLYEDEIRPYLADVKKRASTPSIVYEPAPESRIVKKVETQDQLANSLKHQPTPDELDQKLTKDREDNWKKKLLGGVDSVNLLEPGKGHHLDGAKTKGRSIASVKSDDSLERKPAKTLDADREERRKLLEELSKIKLD